MKKVLLAEEDKYLKTLELISVQYAIYKKKERKEYRRRLIRVNKRVRTLYTYRRTGHRVASDEHSRRIIIEERMRKPRVHDITIRDTYTLHIWWFFNVRSCDNAMHAFQATNYINRKLVRLVSRNKRSFHLHEQTRYNNIIFIARL